MSVSRYLALIPLLTLIGGVDAKPRSLPPANSVPSFSLVIASARNRVESGSDIRIAWVMTNTSQHDVVLDFSQLSRGFFDCSFEVLDDSLFPVRVTESGLHHCLGPISTTCCPDGVLRPGQSMRGESNLRKVYDLQLPGKYSIRLGSVDDLTKAAVRSNAVTVVITGPAPSPSPLSLAISTPRRKLPATAEVRLTVVLTNISDEEIVIWDGRPANMAETAGYVVNVRHNAAAVLLRRDSAGYIHFATGSGMGYQGELIFDGALFHATLKPGETVTNEIVLSEMLDFSDAGNYSIQVARANEDKLQVASKSNIIIIALRK